MASESRTALRGVRRSRIYSASAPIYGQTMSALVVIPTWVFQQIDALTKENWEDFMERTQ